MHGHGRHRTIPSRTALSTASRKDRTDCKYAPMTEVELKNTGEIQCAAAASGRATVLSTRAALTTKQQKTGSARISQLHRKCEGKRGAEGHEISLL